MKRLVIVFLFTLMVSCSPQPEVTEEPVIVAPVEAPEVQVQPEPVAEEKQDLVMAVEEGVSMKCVSATGGQTSTLQMKDGKLRVDTVPADAHAIYTKTMVYTWKGLKGTVMNLGEMRQIAENMGQEYEPESQEQVVAKAEAADARCERVAVSDDVFVPPVDVEFQDLTEVMRQLEGFVAGMK